MTFLPDTITPADRSYISNQWHLLFTDDAWSLGFIGPQLDVAKADPIIKKYIGAVKTSETSDGSAVAFGKLGTFWIFDGEKKGIWGMNATSKFDVAQAVAAGSHLPSGWLMKLTDQLPTNQEMQQLLPRQGWFGPGAKMAWDKLYNRAALEAADRPKIPYRPKELSVNGNVIWVATSPSESAEDNELNSHPGVSILDPGAWEQNAEPDEPSAHQLPMALLTFDASTGKVGPAKVEYTTVLAAAQQGDPAAVAAMKTLNLPIPTV